MVRGCSCEVTPQSRRACRILVIQMAEKASKNFTPAGTPAYDFPRALLKCQMACKILEVGAYTHVNVPTIVFTLDLVGMTQKLIHNSFVASFFTISLHMP